MQVFSDLITLRERRKLHDLTGAMRHSQGADEKVFDHYMKEVLGEG